PRTGLVVVWGPPKCGKSFWTFDLVLHVALGREYRGRRVQQGPVVYCAFEGGGGYSARAEAFRQRNLPAEHDPFDFFLLDAQIDLVKDQPDIVAAIRAQNAAPACVVLDTLNRSLNGSESNDKDMAQYIRAADAIREAFDCVVIIVHHCGVERPRRYCFDFDEVAEAEAQGLPYVLAPRTLSREEWVEQYSPRDEEPQKNE